MNDEDDDVDGGVTLLESLDVVGGEGNQGLELLDASEEEEPG